MHLTRIVAITTLLTAESDAAAVLNARQTRKPTVKSATVVGVVEDAALNRDSCTSSRIGGRNLWTCRDSNTHAGAAEQFFIGSSASWTDLDFSGAPILDSQRKLKCYGSNSDGAYFAPTASQCGGDAGACPDGSRWLIWPDSPPLPVALEDGRTALYTWIRNQHAAPGTLDVINNPTPASLWRTDFDPTTQGHDTLPPARVVDEDFFPAGRPAYGNLGWVSVFGTVFLYANLSPHTYSSAVGLARVDEHSVEDVSAYEYYHPATKTWDRTPHSIGDLTQSVAAGSGAQGTYYYSGYLGSYVWIGAPGFWPGADFAIATAPAPEGPWTTPETFYTGQLGMGVLPAYSQQAHPGLSAQLGGGDDIYLTYTKVDATYSTPLIHVVWN